jgi:dolichol-phosphate mannosyltransferase
MFSLVIPIFNEEELIDELVRRTVLAIESFNPEYEVIFVDDGSTDGSLQKILNCQKQNKHIKALSLSRNFGHQAAFTAGLEHTKGDIVAMMDGDLQDPPELLAAMFQKIKNNDFDVVSGKRKGRRGYKTKNLPSSVFHFVFRKIGDIRNMENYGNFSMMTRNAVNAILSMKEKVRYLPGLRTFVGYRQGYVEFIRDDRFKGEPKMSYHKLFTLATDAIFSFSKFPVRLCLFLGIVGTVVFMIAGIYTIITKIAGLAIIGWTSVMLSIYFLGSIQLIFLGVLGEYIYRNYKESQNRPVYFIKKFYNGE